MLKISLLKTPSIELDGRLIVFPYRRAEALFYYMLVQRSATRQELIDLLWESHDEAAGLKNLRNTLYTIKKVLGGEFLLSPQKSVIIVNPEWVYECDYDKFTREQNTDSYEGLFLKGFAVKQAFSYEEWLSSTRDRLRNQYLQRVGARARQAFEEKAFEQAVSWAEIYQQEDPLNEDVCVFLMQLWRQMRQYPKSAQIYQHFKELMCEEMGAEPMESTTLLYYEVMNEWNETAQPTQERKLPVLIGREGIFGTLCDAAAAFVSGTSRRCSQLVVGEMGTSKSEIIDKVLHNVDLSSALVVRAACLQAEKTVPLALWNKVFLPIAKTVQSENLLLPEPMQARLEQTFFSFKKEKSPNDFLPDRGWRHLDQSLKESVLYLISVLVRRRKLLFVFEDLQWIDEDSLLLVEELLRGFAAENVMMLLSSRSHSSRKTEEFLESAVADGLLLRHRLMPLTKTQTAALLENELGQEVATQLQAQFYEETSGNLFLLTELIRAYQRSKSVTQTLQALNDILLERLNGLDDNALHMAEMLAVFGQDAPCRILLQLVGKENGSLAQGLETLLQEGLIEEYNSSDDIAYGFSHERIRRLVYDRLNYFQRTPLHYQIAELLCEAKLPENSNACRRAAWHFERAGEPLRALACQVRALNQESARSCEAFPLYTGDPAPFVPAAQIEQELHHISEKFAHLRQTEKNAQVIESLKNELILIRGRLALFYGNWEEGAELLGALSAAGREREHSVMVHACYLLAVSALYQQSASQAERYTMAGMRLLQKDHNPALAAQFQRLRGACFCLRGEYEKSSYYYLEAIDALKALPDTPAMRVQMAAAHGDYGRLCRQKQDYATACTHFKKSIALLDTKNWPGAVSILVHYGRAAFLMEDHLHASELFEQAYRQARITGEIWGRTAAAAFCAYYRAENGQEEEAAKALTEAQECDKKFSSPLEGGILCFVCTMLRKKIEQVPGTRSALQPLLPFSAASYARQGIRRLEGITDVAETQLLSRCLRDGITGQQRFRASELYSKNKHFMTE